MTLLSQVAPPPASSEPSTRYSFLRDNDALCLLVLVLLFAVEALMFYTQLADQILPYYPRAYDQTSYAVETYKLIDRFHVEGWSAFLHRIANPLPSGMSFIVQGALLSLVGGPNRGAFISLNLLYFVVLQVCLFVTVRSRTSSTALAWVAIAFLLSVRTHFYFAGGLYDYRMDYSALCLYGIWCCLLLTTRGFRNRSAIAGLGLVSVILVLERFLTTLFIGTVLACLFLATLMATFFARTPDRRARSAESAKNLFFCGAAILLIASPFLLLARHAIFDYYIVGHFFGIEKNIRAAEVGVSSLFDNLTYYPRNLTMEHFGRESLGFIAVVFFGIVLTGLLRGSSLIRCALEKLREMACYLSALAFAIVVPLTFLTFDLSKSPVVAEIVVVPCILILVLLASVFWIAEVPMLPSRASNRSGRRLPVRDLLSAGCVIVALGIFLANGTAAQHYLAVSDRDRVNSLNRTVTGYIIDNGIEQPRISFDRVDEYFNVWTIQLFCYERWRRFIDIAPKFGNGNYGIFATPRDVAMKLLQESDVIVLTDPVVGRQHSAYPMDTKIHEYWGDMWQWTNDNLLPLYATNIGDIPYRVFHKPFVKTEGGSGDWITSQGLTVIANRSDLQRWPFVVLQGNIDLAALGGEPRPRAVSASEAEPAVELPATIKTSGASYRVVIDARAAKGLSGQATIHLTFDRYFVPKQRGINEDTRELVMSMPTLRALREIEDER